MGHGRQVFKYPIGGITRGSVSRPCFTSVPVDSLRPPAWLTGKRACAMPRTAKQLCGLATAALPDDPSVSVMAGYHFIMQ